MVVAHTSKRGGEGGGSPGGTLSGIDSPVYPGALKGGGGRGSRGPTEALSRTCWNSVNILLSLEERWEGEESPVWSPGLIGEVPWKADHPMGVIVLSSPLWIHHTSLW